MKPRHVVFLLFLVMVLPAAGLSGCSKSKPKPKPKPAVTCVFDQTDAVWDTCKFGA